MTRYVCFYCHGHVYEAEEKGCPQCGNTTPSDPVEQVKNADLWGNPDSLDEIFDNVTYADDLEADNQ